MGHLSPAYRLRRDAPPVGKLIAQLATTQHGVVSLGQLRGFGLSKSGIGRRVQAGLLHPVYRGVYAVGIPNLSGQGRYLAAVLAAGSTAVLSHRSAGGDWGVRPNAAGHLDVTVTRHRDSPPGVQLHRTRMLAPQDVTVNDGIPVTSVARTLLDLSAVVSAPELETAVDRAERLGIFDLTAVSELLDRSNGRRGAQALRRVIAAYEPSTQKSVLERRFKALLQTAPDIQTPVFNALVDGERTTHEVDAFWPLQHLAVQVDGFEFHRTRRDRGRDADSDADLELAGCRVMRLTWDDVTVHGERTLRRLRLAMGVSSRVP